MRTDGVEDRRRSSGSGGGGDRLTSRASGARAPPRDEINNNTQSSSTMENEIGVDSTSPTSMIPQNGGQAINTSGGPSLGGGQVQDGKDRKDAKDGKDKDGKDKDGKDGKSSSKRQSYSCAECKRLKLKCSREWPCTSCIRRGVEQICPNGSMTGGKAKRLILADTEELHSRIEQLEKALAVAHGKVTSGAHPLLLNTYLFSPRTKTKSVPSGGGRPGSSPLAGGLGRGKPYANGVKVEPELEGLMEEDEERLEEISLGTLTIGSNGEAVFVGASAGSNYLHTEGPSSPPSSSIHDRPTDSFPFRRSDSSISDVNVIDSENIGLSWNVGSHGESGQHGLLGDFPIGGGGGGGERLTLGQLWERLPDWEEEGKGYIEKYWENASWNYDVIPRPIFDDDLLYAAYQSETVPHPHKLACVFFVMALGVLFDPAREPYPRRAGELFRLGRASLTVGGAFEHPCIATVQALNLMCNYLVNDSSPNGSNMCWPILGAAMKIVISLGLHRDGTTFRGLTPYEIEERRKVFWEMIMIDRLQAMSFARPCSISNRDLDSKYPGADLPHSLLPDADGYHSCKYRLVHIMDRVIHEQTKVTPGSYRDVKEIDDEIQKFRKELSAEMLPALDASDLPYGPEVHPHIVIHRYNIRLLVRETRIYLHRAYFTKAIQEDPADPSRNERRFSKSFVAVFESAVQMIAIVRQSVIYHQSLVARWWFFWFHSFSAAVCLAAVCIGAPGSAFAMPAYQSLVIACDLAEAAVDGSKAKNSLAILRRLRQKSSAAMMSVHHTHNGNVPQSAGSRVAENAKSLEDDDLSHLSNAPKLRRVTVSSPGGARPGARLPGSQSPGSTPTLTHDSTGSLGSGSQMVASGTLPFSAGSGHDGLSMSASMVSQGMHISPVRPDRPNGGQQLFMPAGFEGNGVVLSDMIPQAGNLMQHGHAMHPPAPNPMAFGVGPYFAPQGNTDVYVDDFADALNDDDAMVGGGMDFDMQFQYLAGGVLPSHENLGTMNDLETFLYQMQADNFEQG